VQILVNYCNTCKFLFFCLLCFVLFFCLFLFCFWFFVLLFWIFLAKKNIVQEDAVFKLYVILNYCITCLFINNIFCIHFQSSSPLVLKGVHVARSLIFCEVFCRSLFVLLSFFRLGIVLSVVQLTYSSYPFGTFKLFSDCYAIMRM
jgi:hypothetical protein